MNKCQRGEQNSAGKMHALNMQMFNTPINVQMVLHHEIHACFARMQTLFPLMGRLWGKLGFVEI